MSKPEQPEGIETPHWASGIAASPSTAWRCSGSAGCRSGGTLAESGLFGNFSVPFQDADGQWWYQVKPGLSWPVDFLTPRPSRRRPPFRKAFLGYQHVIAEEGEANSHLVINMLEMPGYGPASLDSKRRNAVRKGLRTCELRLLTQYDKACD